jgi:type IV pilus assembly protein PilO
MKKKTALKDLNFNNTGSWPREYKLGFGIIVGLLIFGLLWWLFVRDKSTELEGLERQNPTFARNSKPSRAGLPTWSR